MCTWPNKQKKSKHVPLSLLFYIWSHKVFYKTVPWCIFVITNVVTTFISARVAPKTFVRGHIQQNCNCSNSIPFTNVILTLRHISKYWKCSSFCVQIQWIKLCIISHRLGLDRLAKYLPRYHIPKHCTGLITRVYNQSRSLRQKLSFYSNTSSGFRVCRGYLLISTQRELLKLWSMHLSRKSRPWDPTLGPTDTVGRSNWPMCIL